MDGDDELFGPKPSPPLTSKPPPIPAAAATDVRAIGRAVGALLCALGRPTEAEIARANTGLQRLALPVLTARDLVQATPESLAPLVPVEARAGLAALLRELAGEQPIRARLALAYAQLWDLATATVPPPTDAARGGAMMRWIVGKLPAHVTAPEAPPADGGPYRGGGMGAPEPARPSRPAGPTLRERVERIGAQFADVRAAVEQVIIGKREVVERVLCAIAARGHVLLVDVPGTGKTQLCKALAAAIDLKFS